MKAVLQRVTHAEVRVDGAVVGHIGPGLLIFLGVGKGDGPKDVTVLAKKVLSLRIFPGKSPMDRSVQEVQGSVLVVSQFTLLGNTHKGNRPSFDPAEEPGKAKLLYELFVEEVRREQVPVATGIFGAEMAVSLENDGPVTFLLETQDGRMA